MNVKYVILRVHSVIVYDFSDRNFAYKFVSIFLHTHTKTNTHKHTHAHKQTHKHTQKHTHTNTHTHTHTHTTVQYKLKQTQHKIYSNEIVTI
jgi:ABC-type nickel/cobalt efflux system permease component RcnA